MQSPAVLMPAADYYVAFISRYETELAQHFHFNIPEASVLAMLMDKREQYKLAEESGVPIPKTFSLRSGDDLDKVSTLISYPAIVKGAHSHQWTSSFQGRKGYVAYSPDDLRRVSEQASTRGVEAVIQEMVLGPNHNHLKVCTYYSKDNELLAAFCTQKIRQYPVDMGIGTSMISIHTPELLELSCRFLERLGYTGVSSIEFKKDERDGRFKLIELNPRFWQQNIQATHAQVNFANINYLDCLGQTVEPCLDFKQGIRWIDAFPDLRSFVSQSRKSNLSLLDWLRRVLDADCRAFLAKDDVRPVWKYVWNILGHIASQVAQTSPTPVSSLGSSH
jgi:predicted ATP-grasp superfamily ATP-dependent carboligase